VHAGLVGGYHGLLWSPKEEAPAFAGASVAVLGLRGGGPSAVRRLPILRRLRPIKR